jgi:hypothetical protein
MQIRVNLRRFFIEGARLLLLLCGMAADEEVGEHLGENLGGDDPGRALGVRYEPESSGPDPRANPRPTWAWEDAERARPLGLVITAALLFVLVAAAVLFGGRSSFGPAGPPSIMGPGGKALGEILYSLELTVSCPLASSDATGSVAGRPPERCPTGDRSESSHPHD